MSVAPRAVPPSVNAWNADYLEVQYLRFKADPASVPADVQAFFQGFDLAVSKGLAAPGLGAGVAGAPGPGQARGGGGVKGDSLRDALRLHRGAANLIDAHRRDGHLAAALDPFNRPRPRPACLELACHGLTQADLARPVDPGALPVPPGATLGQVVDLLKRIYGRTIGAQFMHVPSNEERAWLTQRLERDQGAFPLTRAQRAHILEQLIRAEQFEKFLGKRYPGDKRFSLEGGESLIACLDRIIEAASNLGVEEIVAGMSHRGRLNVLNNIMGKTYEQIFTEFEDNWEAGFADGGGDVKYHRGYSGTRTLPNGKTVHMAMSSNPSHLESVDGVVEGRCRAKQRLRNDTERRRVIPLLIHGDAAVIAQGVVAEVLNFSQLEGYTTGGTIHVVANNLIGFTTGPEDARSTPYCTDIALLAEVPTLHVNGEDPEAVVAVAQVAVEYRQQFKKDIFIDLWCFRLYGHNETDEPSFTQPVLARLIKGTPSVLTVYSQRLLSEGVLTEADMKVIRERLDQILEGAQAAAKVQPHDPTIDPGSKRWEGCSGTYAFDPVDTGVPMDTLSQVCAALGRVPDGFIPNPKLKKLLAERADLPRTKALSYADAESLAFGALLLEGHGVRLSGQDSRRGTFSHRHAALRDFQTGAVYVPLNHMRPIAPRPDDAGKLGPDGALTQGRLCVHDSPLSEFGVMAFEYGYSLADPNMLVMWEAQFGDFCNGAQVIIDQYLASAELKWDRWCGLALLLPHGYEGAGPEHSSARLERFLQLCANNNMEVVNPSTAAQAFHLFRRQVKRSFRKPLIVMTPKSMLRVATSTIDELTAGSFREVLDDPMFDAGPSGADRKAVTRVLLCSGKISFELAARRDELKRRDTAIVRVEQLYPLHADLLRQVLGRYPARAVRVWVQEEPRNAGAYLFIADLWRAQLGLGDLPYIGRDASATPAVGSKHKSKEQQEAILGAAIGPHADGAGKSNGSAATAKSTKPAPPTKKISTHA